MDLILTSYLPTAEERQAAEEDSGTTLGKRKHIKSSGAIALQAIARMISKSAISPDALQIVTAVAAKHQPSTSAGKSKKTHVAVSLAGGPPPRKRK